MIMPCQVCGTRTAEHCHHLFSQTKLNRKLYGGLLDRPENIIFVCSVCHLNKPVPKLTEQEFCNRLGIDVRSKTGKARML